MSLNMTVWEIEGNNLKVIGKSKLDNESRQTFKREEAKTFTGIFANQNIVCKLRHQPTLDFLKKEFNVKETD
jgi:hypothetical protein